MATLSNRESSVSIRRVARFKKLPRRQFIQWAVSELGGKWQAGWERSRGFQGHIVVWPAASRNLDNPPLTECEWYPVQVTQKDKAGRPDIDLFEAVMMREECNIGYFVAFDYTRNVLGEIRRFFKRTGKEIKILTVREILAEELAPKRG
jgi:hypothetical protein